MLSLVSGGGAGGGGDFGCGGISPGNGSGSVERVGALDECGDGGKGGGGNGGVRARSIGKADEVEGGENSALGGGGGVRDFVRE